MPHWLRVILLGAVQGITEFIPVSSSGHLVLLQEVLDLRYPGISLEIAVHLGTLAAVLSLYGRDCGRIALSLLRGIPALLGGRRSPADLLGEPHFYWGIHLLLASAVTVAVVAPAQGAVRLAFSRLTVVCGAWTVTGLMLMATRGLPRGSRPLRPGTTVVVGLVQALAAVPGISRSGVTIAAGLFCGLPRTDAARFSFLLSIPAVLGAVIMDLPEATARAGDAALAIDAALAAGVAAVTGYFALRLVVGRVVRGQLHRFALYLLPLALLVAVWLQFGG